jgi:hypothetical protein
MACVRATRDVAVFDPKTFADYPPFQTPCFAITRIAAANSYKEELTEILLINVIKFDTCATQDVSYN